LAFRSAVFCVLRYSPACFRPFELCAVIPAEAGIQAELRAFLWPGLDSRFRGNDSRRCR
jgi:hypothetical protein